MTLSPATQLNPSLRPAAHLPRGVQIGQGWMKVRQVLLGQSASVMQPKFAFAPPTHAPVSQEPERAQSPSAQHDVLAACPPPAAQRPVSLTQLPPGHGVPAAMVPQPPVPVQLPPALVPPLHRIGIMSASRKMPELSGTFRPVTLPAVQSAVPEALAVIVLTTHVLVAAPWCEELGIGSGGPKRQPAFVHFSRAHFALAQLPLTHEGGDVVGEQSASVVHVPAQALLAVQEAPRVELAPWMHRLPPAWVAVVPETVSVVPLQVTFEIDDPWSGTLDGSGTPTPAPPK